MLNSNIAINSLLKLQIPPGIVASFEKIYEELPIIYRLLKHLEGCKIPLFQLSVWCEKCVVIWKKLQKQGFRPLTGRGLHQVRTFPHLTREIASTIGDNLHGRQVYRHENGTQHIFYVYGEFDGWLLGPRPGKKMTKINDEISESKPVKIDCLFRYKFWRHQGTNILWKLTENCPFFNLLNLLYLSIHCKKKLAIFPPKSGCP